ncbi:hypothetical protein [Chitinophaga pinensis]|nr:hypothetical protein [Chitinophaga pinensis]
MQKECCFSPRHYAVYAIPVKYTPITTLVAGCKIGRPAFGL